MALAVASAGRTKLVGRVQKDLACFRCGYNLRGLERSGVCPECGESIAAADLLDALPLADPAWIRHLRRGAGLAMAGLVSPWLALVAGVGIRLVGDGMRFGDAHAAAIAVGTLLALPGPVLVAAGALLLTQPDPRVGPEGVGPQRQLARVASCLAAGLWPVAAGAILADVTLSVAVALLAVVTSAGAVWGLTHWIDDLGRRASDRVLRQRTGWLRALATISATLLTLGPAVLLVFALRNPFGGFAVIGGGELLLLMGGPLGLVGAIWVYGALLGLLEDTRSALDRVMRLQRTIAARERRNSRPAASSSG